MTVRAVTPLTPRAHAREGLQFHEASRPHALPGGNAAGHDPAPGSAGGTPLEAITRIWDGLAHRAKEGWR